MRQKKAPLTKYEKLEKAVSESFAEQFRSAQDDAVKNKIVDLNNEIEKQTAEKKSNIVLKELAEKRKALNGGYIDLINEYKKQIKFLLVLLESRGKL